MYFLLNIHDKPGTRRKPAVYSSRKRTLNIPDSIIPGMLNNSFLPIERINPGPPIHIFFRVNGCLNEKIEYPEFHRFSYSPLIPTRTCRSRGPSNSQKYIPCQVPRASRPSMTGTVREKPISDALI